MIEYPSEIFWTWFGVWSLLWIVIINIAPGPKEIVTAYRLNFWHGLLSSLAALLCILGYIPEQMASPCTISYFLVDFVNIMLNDFVHKVPSYQSPPNRRVEYAHHILCFIVGITSEIAFKDQCSFTTNPFIRLMFAEFSTPFLIAWRQYGGDLLGGLFVVSFIACRIIYHGLMFIPECVRSCKPIVGYGFAIPYNLMNFYFLYMIMRKFMKPATGGKKEKKSEREDDKNK